MPLKILQTLREVNCPTPFVDTMFNATQSFNSKRIVETKLIVMLILLMKIQYKLK